MTVSEYDAPCGKLLLGVHGRSICLCDWMRGERVEKTMRRLSKHIPLTEDAADDRALLAEAKLRLEEYFSGVAKKFDVPITAYGTEFQCRVWEALQEIPYGETVSYKAIAVRAGRSGGVRAVASAIGANPLSILIPCHRVIGSDGTLTGYAGGIDAKRYLLNLEGSLSS